MTTLQKEIQFNEDYADLPQAIRTCNLHTPGDSFGCISAERLLNQHVSYGTTSDSSKDWKVGCRAANVAWFRKTGYRSSPSCSRTAADSRQIPTGNHGTCSAGQCRKVHSGRLLSLQRGELAVRILLSRYTS